MAQVFLIDSHVALRMTARDNAGKDSKKPKKHHYDEHFNKDWDKDLWD